MKTTTRRVTLVGTGALLAAGVAAVGASAAATATVAKNPDLRQLSPSIKDPSSPVTVTFQSWVGSSPNVQALAKQFHQLHPNITIKFSNVSADSADQKLATQIAGGNAPDVAWMDAGSVGDYASRHAVASLDEYISKSKGVVPKDYAEAFFGSMKLDGKTYGLPIDGESTALFYRKDRFRAAGIKQPPRTWAQFETAAKKLTDPAKKQYGFIIFGPESAYYWYPWLWQAGGDLTSRDGKTITFNNAAGRRAASFYVGLAKYSPPDQYNSNSWDGRVTFAQGSVAMYEAGSWFASTLDEQFPKIKGKWSVAPLPTDGGRCGTTIAGDALTILNTSKNKDAAWKWIEFLSAPQNMKIMTLGTKAHPGSQLPTRLSLLNDPATYRANPVLKGFAQQMKCGRINTSANPKWPRIEQKLNDQLARAIYGKATAADALDGAAKEAKTILASG